MTAHWNDDRRSGAGGGAPPPGGASPGRPSEPGAKQKQDATTFSVLPRFATAVLMPETPGKLLTALKDQIAQLTIEQAGSGIRHEGGKYVVLPNTLRSAWLAKVRHSVLGELKFLVGQTRSTWVLLYDTPHERLYEDPRFMGVELKQRDVALTSKGKRMYVSRIEKRDLDQINAIAAKDAGAAGAPDTLAPTEGAFSFAETMARLRRSVFLGASDDRFDPDEFLESVRFMTPTQGSAGNYYYLDAGDPEDPVTCELHVGKDPQLPAGAFRHKATFAYRSERCYLYIDIQL